jgi:hypothetical protein
VPRTRHAIRPAAPSLRLLGSDAASGTAAQQRAAGCSMCRPQRDRSPVALGCNTVHVVATQCMWLQHSVLLRHTCLAQREMSRKAAVATQMSAWAWIRSPGRRPGAQVGAGSWTCSRCRCGRGHGHSPGETWVGGGPNRGGDAGRYEPSPVVSDERRPKTKKRA